MCIIIYVVRAILDAKSFDGLGIKFLVGKHMILIGYLFISN